MENQNKKSYAIPFAIVIAGLLISGTLYFSRDRVSVADPTAVGSAKIVKVDEDDDYILGNPEAPVTFVNFGDLRCSFCAEFQRTIKPTIVEKYVKTGKVKYVYRDFITMGENSILAAGGANCAGEQGRYWDFTNNLHTNRAGYNTIYTKKSLTDIASSLGLDKQVFTECLAVGKYVDEIEKDTKAAIAAGASGTPTVFINGVMVEGINPLSLYESIIEDELSKNQ